MDLSMSSKEDPFAPDSIFSQQDLPVVPNDNPESYCRLCLTTPEVVPLFPTDSDPNEFVLELIGKYIGIGLTIQDDSPCSVCNSCQMILDQFDLFRQNCLKVDIAIRRRRLGLDRVVKSEPQDDDGMEEVDLPYVRLENRVYQCRVCSELFRSMALFMAHCKEEHPDEAKMYKCKHCTKSFMTKTARLQHIRSHRPSNSESDFGGIRVQVCEKCMVTFDSYKLLKIHIKEHHSNDPKQDTLVCTTCSRQFSRITILRNHILRVHMGKLPHVCKQCGISFGYTQQLVSHLKSEHGISPDQYGLFPEDDAEPEEATGIVPPPPQVAPAPAPAPVVNLEELQPPPAEEPTKDDSNRKPLNKYTCMECREQCYSQEELRNHRKIHQDPTWYKCTHCRNFVKHREMHLQKKHPTISESELESSFTLRYRCWMCRMYFKSLHLMEVHANIKHQVPLPDHHQEVVPPTDELEEGEIRPDVTMGAPLPVPVPSMLPPLPTMALPGMPQALTAQPPINPEHFPLLLSQLENGALDYLREFSRLIDPNNQLGLAGQLNIKPEPVDTFQSAMDLSGNSALNMTAGSTATDFHSSRDDTAATEHEDGHEGDNDSEDDTFFRLDNRTYQCKFCPETFRHLQQIRKHTKLQHPSEWKSFKCVHCKRRFPSGPMRDRHVHFHSLNHPFKCTECDQMYRSKKRLEKHFEVFHDRNSHTFSMERFHCGSCDLTFVEKKYYDLHSRIYHDRKPQRLKNLSDKIQVCERCVKIFDSRDLLMDHIRESHQGDPPLKNCICQTCSKDLKTITLLRIHILVVHLGIMPFVCQHCRAEFATRHWLLKHLEKDHSEVALFKCPSCDESFTTESRMTEHKDKVHAQLEIEFDPQSGKAVYPCGKCEKKLESKDLLDKHQLKAHPSFMLMYKCPLCPQSVRYRKQHMRVHHDVEYEAKEHSYQVRYKCHCCAKLFQQKRNLLAHQNSLSNQCSRCQMRFKTKKNLQAHLAAHRSNRSLKCEDCGLDFGYRGRLEEHRKRYHSATSTQVLKIINCPYCPKLFISPSNRERHIVANHVQSDFKVNCGHCPVQVTETMLLRKHYKSVHPEERVTFKCPGCEKFYLNLSSFKDHYKKHKKEDEAEDKKGTNSTSKAVDDGKKEGDQVNHQNSGGALESIIIKEETIIQSGNAAAPEGSAATGITDNALNAGEMKMEIKYEPRDNGEAATSKDLTEEEKSMVAEGTCENKSAMVVKEEKVDSVDAKESTVEPVVAEQPGLSAEQQATAEESTSEEKPVLLTTEEQKLEQKMEVEEPVGFEDPAEKMAVDEPKTEENMEVEEAVQLSTNESTATVQPEQNIPQENASVGEETPKVEEPKSDEKMEVDEIAEETPCKSTSEVHPKLDITSDHEVSVVEKEQPEEKITAKEEFDSKPAEQVKPEQKTSSEIKSPQEQNSAVDEPKPNETAMTGDATEEIKPERTTASQEQATAEEEIDSKPAEETKPKQETSSESEPPEEDKSAVETTEELKLEPSSVQKEQATAEEEIDTKPAEEVKPIQETCSESEPPEEDKLAVGTTGDVKSEPSSVQKEQVTAEGEIDSKSAEELQLEHETSSESEPPEEDKRSSVQKEQATAEVEIDSKPAEQVKPKQQTSSVSESHEEDKLAVGTTGDLKSEPSSVQKEQVTAEEGIDSKSAEELQLEHETSSKSESPEEQQSAVEEPKPNETTMVEETADELKHAPATSQELVKPEEKTPVEETTTSEERVNKSESADVKPKQEIALENVVLSENPNLSDAPLVESCSGKDENSERVDPSFTDKMGQEGVENEERMVQQDNDTNKDKEGETVEEPPAEKHLEESLPECSSVDETPEEAASLAEHSESKPENEDCKVNAVDKLLTEDAPIESEKSHPTEKEWEQKLESPATVEEPQEPAPEDPASSVQTRKDDPPLEDLRSANNSPASTLVESPYTIVESSNEASEVSESSAVSERSTKPKLADDRRRISTRNILKRKKKLVVLLEPVDIDKLMELSRGSSSSSSPSMDRVAMKGSGGSSSESQPAEDGVRAKRLRRERGTPTSDTVAGDS